uniref:Solute carrier family 43 member 3a n=1 Tax=Anabas testudineus TaxID=64144 RepID=A0A7N6F7E2_ANATE
MFSCLLYSLTLVSGMLECLCFAGAVFGYASLVFVLKEDGYFSQGCISIPGTNNTSENCSRQDMSFSLVFTIASFLNSFLSLFSGYIFDRFGTMVTRLLGIIIVCDVFHRPSAYSELLFPAMSCISVGGIQLLLTNMQVGNLFAAHRTTIITVYNGAFDSSAAVFLVIKVVSEQGISLFSSFAVMSLCSIIHLLRTFLLLPRTHIPFPLPQDYNYGWDYYMNFAEETEARVMSFRSCVLSWFFLWHLLWLSIMELRHYLFIGTLNHRLNRLTNNDPDLVLCAPWNGLIMDRHKGKPLAPGETDQEADLRSSFLSLFLTSLQCLLFSVCASIPLLPLQYFTFVVQVLNRSFLYGGNAAFISIAFPACHFGKVYGLMIAMSAVISLLQYPCFTLVKGPLGGDPFFVDIALTLLTLLLFIHPVYVFIHCRKLARNRADNTQTEATGSFILAEAKL